MRVKYRIAKMPLLQQSKCMGDLMKYYGERKFKLMEQVHAISNNEMVSSKLLNTIRKHGGMAGLSIEQFVQGLQTASDIDVFSFKVNDVDPCKMFKGENLELEVYMNPIYFSTQASLSVAMPGFRKHKENDVEKLVLKKARMEQNRWLRWFDKELNNYHPSEYWKKTVVEE